MKQILSQINDVIESLEDKGHIVEAAKLDNMFVRMAQQSAPKFMERPIDVAQLFSLSVVLPEFHKENVRKNGQPGIKDPRFIDERLMPSKAYWKTVQTLVGAKVDGIPGQETFTAVQNFIANNKNADEILASKLSGKKKKKVEQPKNSNIMSTKDFYNQKNYGFIDK
jgi:hypothetical protein